MSTGAVSLVDLINQAMSGGAVERVSQELGVGEDATRQAIGAAVPTLLRALANKTADPSGAAAVHRAIERDHDGSVLDNLPQLLQGGGLGQAGQAILGHVLGGQQGRVEQGISKAAGLDAASTAKLLQILAPVVMGAVGRQQRSAGHDSGGLAGVLRRETSQMEQQNPQGMSIIGRMLDADGDGDVDVSDLLQLGQRLFGSLMRR